MHAAAVLFNNKNPLSSVDYPAVTDALLSGGIFLDELVALPYDASEAITSALLRLISDHTFVYLICDGALLPSAREALTAVTGKTFTEDFSLEDGERLCFVLPAGQKGAELVHSETVPRVDEKRGNSYLRTCIRTVCAPPALVRETLKKAEAAAEGRLLIHMQTSFGNGRIEVIYDRATPKMTADEVVRILATDLRDYIYSMDDESMEQRLVDALKLHRMHISTAESFTGGGVGAAIVSVAGASSVFYEGLNTYDSGSKQDRLGVSELTLMQKGAVSDQTAYEMAAGLLEQGHCDIAIATTGYAGPSREGQPAGLCYLAIGTKENVRVYRPKLTGDRETITKTAIQLALFLAFREITRANDL